MPRLPFCLCGVRGGDLTQRIESILAGRRLRELTRARRATLVLGALSFLAAPVVLGALTLRSQVSQSTAFDGHRFEVVSVRRNISGDSNMRVRFPGARFEATNIQIRELIRIAHGFQSFQLVNGPEWLTTERYDIVAAADRTYTPGPEGVAPEVIAMLRTMLAERFGIRLRAEKRELPLFELRLARSDGHLGPGMRPVKVDCEAEARQAASRIPTGQSGAMTACNVRVASTQLMGRGLTLVQLSTALSRAAGIDRPVIDRTGLTGSYDVDLNWTPEARTAAGDTSSPAAADAPGLFTAVQEQLGLRLQAHRGPVEVFVIVRATRPAENDAVGQEPGAPGVFEVAAVRLNRSGQIAAQFDDLPGGRFVAVNTTVRMLILDAYRIPDRQLVDAPDWTRTERVDVNAKLEREAPIVRGTAGERQLALRSLLAERFTLRVHRETRQVPMYALVMARADRRPGPILNPSLADCSSEGMRARANAAQAGQPLPGMCGTRATDGRLQFGGLMSDLARTLSGSAEIGRNVVDQTGLNGVWQFELPLGERPQQRPPGLEPVANDPNAPSLITALQEQLGLKLESIQGPMEFLIVDRVERLDRQDAVDPRP